MFTGIIQHRGSVREVNDTDFGRRLVVDAAGWAQAPRVGESIAVDGCCLTVAEVAHKVLRFDVIAQTLRMTNLGQLAADDEVNLEHAVTPSTMLGGHIVQGHVDGVGRVANVARSTAEHRLRIAPSERTAMALIVNKGSIAMNGVSLTVADVSGAASNEAWFEVALIPTTLALTNLGGLEEGDCVNLEYDYVAKVVANWLTRTAR